jgi:hypothetical protein
MKIFFKDLINLIKLRKNEYRFKRVFFFENKFIEPHILPFINKNKNIEKSCIISLYKLNKQNTKNLEIYYFNSFFFLKLAFLFLKISYVYSSTPDLNNTVFIKSIYNKIKYIYLQHSPVSLTMIYSEKAFHHFDLVQVINSFQNNEIKEINNKFSLNIKPWKKKYYLWEKKIGRTINSKEKILIAPTWGTDFYKKNLHYKITENINFSDYDIFFRPHFMSIQKKEIQIEDLKKLYNLAIDEFYIENYDFLITDWSGIFFEFSKYSSKKSILINCKKKINNPNYSDYLNKPIEIKARNILGHTIEINELEKINELLKRIRLETKSANNDKEIENFFIKNFY